MTIPSREIYKTYGDVFDRSTIRGIFELQSKGYFDELKSPVSIGKEANIFTAERGDGPVIVKIYRTQTCDFKKMYSHLVFDPRFRIMKRSRRPIVFTWAQREFRNLLKAKEAGMHSPTPYAIQGNIVVMELIGNKVPANKVKKEPPSDTMRFYKDLLQEVKLLYHKAKLVHADLSEYNILNFNERPYLIDFSQSIPLEHTDAETFLKRDIRNMVAYFHKLGLALEEEKTLKEIKHGIRARD